MKRSRHERAGLLTDSILSTFALATGDLAAFPIHPGCRHEAHPIPPLCLPHGRHLGTRWVRVAIDDPFVRSGPDPQVAKAAKDAADALVLEDTQLRKMTLPAGAEAYSSRAE